MTGTTTGEVMMMQRYFVWCSVVGVALAGSACERSAPRADSPNARRTLDSAGGSVVVAPPAVPSTRRAATPGAASAAPNAPAPDAAVTALAPASPAPSSAPPAVAPAAAPAPVPAPVPGTAPPLTAPAPTSSAPAASLAPAATHRPFGAGERFQYEVKYGFLHAGDATLQVLGPDDVRGTPALHARFIVHGGTRFFSVDDNYDTWFDPYTMSSLRYVQHISEGRYTANRDFEIFPQQRTYSENGQAPQPSVPDPLDEASFIYFLRTIPLETGRSYDFDRYFRPDRNPVRVIVLRRERITVPAGAFNTVVVRPVIKAKGLFAEGGQAEVWLTDDSARTMVQMRSHLPIGSLSLYLTGVAR